MAQEIKINLTLTLEADLGQTRGDMENFVRNLLVGAQSGEALSLNKYHINKIEEEAKIYAADRDKSDGVWDFVEKFYPKYYSCNEIMCNDELCKIVNGELNGDAETIFREEFKNDLGAPIATFNQSTEFVYERAIMGCQRSQQGTISIVWGLQDVEDRAKDKGYLLKEGEAQQVLDMLKDKHDCNIGITWDVMDDYLSYILPDPT